MSREYGVENKKYMETKENLLFTGFAGFWGLPEHKNLLFTGFSGFWGLPEHKTLLFTVFSGFWGLPEHKTLLFTGFSGFLGFRWPRSFSGAPHPPPHDLEAPQNQKNLKNL